MDSRKSTEAAPAVSSEPNLFDVEALNGPPPPGLAPEKPEAAFAETPGAPVVLTGWRLWAERIWLVVYVVFCIELGLLLAVLPWTKVWTDNSLIINRPLLHALAQDNFLRGLVTGVGLVDIWLGIWEAVRYREPKAKPAPPAS